MWAINFIPGAQVLCGAFVASLVQGVGNPD